MQARPARPAANGSKSKQKLHILCHRAYLSPCHGTYDAVLNTDHQRKERKSRCKAETSMGTGRCSPWDGREGHRAKDSPCPPRQGRPMRG